MNPLETRKGLAYLISEQKMSSISIISEQLGIDEDLARAYLQELVNDGELKGYITEDGRRFFTSDVQVTSAPVAIQQKEWNPDTHDTKKGKMILIIGIFVLILGQVMTHVFTSTPDILGLGGVLVMFGYGILISGLAYIGYKNKD